MEMVDQKRLLLQRLLDESRKDLPRPAHRFLESLLAQDDLLERLAFCRPEERPRVRNSIMLSGEGGGTWAVLLGNDPSGGRSAARARARLALDGLELSTAEVLVRLSELPIWFLTLDSSLIDPPPGRAADLERCALLLAAVPSVKIRRLALLDQLDAALDADDREAWDRILILLRRLDD